MCYRRAPRTFQSGGKGDEGGKGGSYNRLYRREKKWGRIFLGATERKISNDDNYDDMGKMNLGLGVFTRVLIYTKYRSDA